MSNNLHAGHRERLRNSASINGIEKMQEHQVLELLLTYVIPQKDVNPMAHELINKFGSFSAVLDAKTSDLMKVKGVGNKTAHFLSSLKEFFFVYKQKGKEAKPVIKSTNDAVVIIKDLLEHKPQEEMYAIVIDGLNNVKKIEQISIGTSNATAVSIRKITELVFSSGTHNVIICHNHPMGSYLPSVADDKLTKGLVMALSMNNINLLDHIIIGNNGYYSYNLSNKLQSYISEIEHLINAQVIMQNACKYN